MPAKKVLPANAKITHESPDMFRTMRVPHIAGSVFGLLPTCGVAGNSVKDLEFRWCSFRTAYTFFYLFLESVLICTDFYNFLVTRNRLFELIILVYRCHHMLFMIAFLMFSIDLRKLMLIWTQIDTAMNKVYGQPRGIDIRIKAFSVGYLIFFAVTVFVDLNTYLENLRKQDGSIDIESYIFGLSPFISAKYRELNYTSGITVLLVHIHILFCVAYNNYLIVLYSTAVSLRFEQIAERIETKGNNESSKEFWIKVRADYVRLSKLFRKLNNYISLNVALSFSSSTLTLIEKLFVAQSNVFKLPKIYNVTECVFYIINCLIISFYTAWINEASKKPAAVLNAVASNKYDREIRRLLTQIAFDNIVLTGGNLFKCTRNLIFNITGAIIAYELVLIQLYN